MADSNGAPGAHSPHSELDRALEEIELQTRALAAKRARVLARAKATGAHNQAGHRTIAGYVRSVCSSSTTSSKKDQTLAALINDHPDVADALEAGHISIDHAHEIARIHTNPRICDLLDAVLDTLLDMAEHLSWGRFRQQVGTLIGLADQDGAFKEQERNHETRSAWIDDMGNTLHLSASGGDPITAAQLLAIFETFTDAELKADLDARKAEWGGDAEQHPLPRTQPQRNFDALVAIFSAAAGSPGASKLPEPTVNVIIDERSLHDAFAHAGLMLPNGNQIDLDPDGNITNHDELLADLVAQLEDDPDSLTRRKCVLSTGAAIHPSVAIQALLTGHIRRVVVDSRSVITDLGTRSRVFTGAARDAALLLTNYCEHRGCQVRSRHSQVDHMIEWNRDGTTDQSNAQPRCGPHNRFKHKHDWQSRRDDNGRAYDIRPDGSIVLAAGERPPDLTGDELIAKARARARALATQSSGNP